MRSLLLAASFPPAVGGVETLLYQTNRRLAEPPQVRLCSENFGLQGLRLKAIARVPPQLAQSLQSCCPVADQGRGECPEFRGHRATRDCEANHSVLGRSLAVQPTLTD